MAETEAENYVYLDDLDVGSNEVYPPGCDVTEPTGLDLIGWSFVSNAPSEESDESKSSDVSKGYKSAKICLSHEGMTPENTAHIPYPVFGIDSHSETGSDVDAESVTSNISNESEELNLIERLSRLDLQFADLPEPVVEYNDVYILHEIDMEPELEISEYSQDSEEYSETLDSEDTVDSEETEDSEDTEESDEESNNPGSDDPESDDSESHDSSETDYSEDSDYTEGFNIEEFNVRAHCKLEDMFSEEDEASGDNSSEADAQVESRSNTHEDETSQSKKIGLEKSDLDKFKTEPLKTESEYDGIDQARLLQDIPVIHDCSEDVPESTSIRKLPNTTKQKCMGQIELAFEGQEPKSYEDDFDVSILFV